MAPRGFDAVSLWACSLAVPDIADRIRRERHADMTSRSGRLAALYHCAVILRAHPDPADGWHQAAEREAVRVLAELEAPG